jgi:hypothetical protein
MAGDTLLDLSAARTVTLTDRGRTFKLHCRRITKDDYLAYFAAFRVTSEQTQDGLVRSQDYSSASLVLAERVLVDAEGYTVTEGKLTDLPNWQSRIPLAHRFVLGNTLVDAGPSKPAEDAFFNIRANGEEVSIDAVWSAAEDGSMTKFEGLKHIFKTPTPAQHKRFRDASSRALVVGGSRTGLTIYYGAHATLVDLYDELIVHVDGYAFEQVSMCGLPAQTIAREMDCWHKFVAAKQLFDPESYVQPVQPEATEEVAGE